MKSRFFRNITILLMMVCIASFGFAKGSKDEGQTPQTLPDWSEERPIPDFGFSEGEMPPEPPEGFDGESMPTPPNGMQGDFDPTKMGFPGGMGGGNPPVNQAAENQSERNILTNQNDFIENVSFPSSVEMNLTGQTIRYFWNATEENVDIQYNDNGIIVNSKLKEGLNIKLTGELEGTFTIESSEIAPLLSALTFIATSCAL